LVRTCLLYLLSRRYGPAGVHTTRNDFSGPSHDYPETLTLTTAGKASTTSQLTPVLGLSTKDEKVANQNAAIDKSKTLVLAIKSTFGLQLTLHGCRKNKTKSISDGASKTQCPMTRGTSGTASWKIAKHHLRQPRCLERPKIPLESAGVVVRNNS
jgi:hypothetical protein